MKTEMRRLVVCLSISLLASCNEETSSAPTGGGVGSASAKTAGGGFSADLAKEFASGSGSGSGSAKAGGGKAGDAKAGDAKAADAKAADAKAGDAKAGSGDAKAADAKAGDAKAGDAKAGDAKAGDAKAGNAPAGDTKVADAKDAKVVPDALRSGTGPGPVIQSSGAVPKKVNVPAELAAIKLGMLPNWERDVQDAGTLSLAVKIPGRSESAVFVFRYGYEDASAPADREAYKKWLADKRLLNVRQDRQSASSWYLEGADGSGNPAFRFVVSWGGKKLICYGSLYRDPESSKLGDLRDQTVVQAKQICETVAL